MALQCWCLGQSHIDSAVDSCKVKCLRIPQVRCLVTKLVAVTKVCLKLIPQERQGPPLCVPLCCKSMVLNSFEHFPRLPSQRCSSTKSKSSCPVTAPFQRGGCKKCNFSCPHSSPFSEMTAQCVVSGKITPAYVENCQLTNSAP